MQFQIMDLSRPNHMCPKFLSLLDTEYENAFTNNYQDLYDISVDKQHLVRIISNRRRLRC